jgi:hypothetical protein
MPEIANAEAGCRLVAEYCDEGDLDPQYADRRAEAVRPNRIVESTDVWERADRLRDFTVLMRDGRTVQVQGHGLRHIQKPGGSGDYLCIIVQSDADPVTVASFDPELVSGIFHGTIHDHRAIA